MEKIGLFFLLIIINAFQVSLATDSLEIKKFCDKLDESFKTYGWEKSQCEQFDWKHVRNSVLGDPLVWTIFGDTTDEHKPSFKEKDLTIIMCGVHGDEITPIKFCFDLLYYLKELYSDPEALKKEFKDKIVLVAPLVNPDSFLKNIQPELITEVLMLIEIFQREIGCEMLVVTGLIV